MAFVDDFSDMLTQTITWSPLTGRDGYSAPSYGSPVSLKCRIERKNRLVTNSQGQQVTSTASAIIQGHPVIDPQDLIKFDDGTLPTIVSVAQIPDENGPCYTKIFFL